MTFSAQRQPFDHALFQHDRADHASLTIGSPNLA
jgi:hypothetical protein